MPRPDLPQRTLATLAVGEKATFRRTLTETDTALFIGVTWDVNPLHTDDLYVQESTFGRRIVPGLLTASLLTHLGGLWAFLATEMHIEFLAPVYINDTITAEAEIMAIDRERGKVQLGCRCVNQAGELVLRGEIGGYPPSLAGSK
jgi:3-hydroxybutyryl-CoA dehydratase